MLQLAAARGTGTGTTQLLFDWGLVAGGWWLVAGLPRAESRIPKPKKDERTLKGDTFIRSLLHFAGCSMNYKLCHRRL